MTCKDWIRSVLRHSIDPEGLWRGQYKLPWNDPDFSRRMLDVHLAPEGDLASRRHVLIDAQAEWIHERICKDRPARLLDLGCGPGLYLERLARRGHRCRGIDFSPASVAHAKSILPEACEILEGDLRSVDFGQDHDVVMMVYGELNVFSPDECASLLRRSFDALVPGGLLLIEPFRFAAVKELGQSPKGWYCAQTGLFGETPHLCLMANHWFAGQAAAVTVFHVIDSTGDPGKSYRSTTKAWSDDDYRRLLGEAGFTGLRIHDDWPGQVDDLALWTARRP